MSSTSPSSSSSAAASAPTFTPYSTYPFSTSSPPIWIGLIGISFLIFCYVCIMKWFGISWREFRDLFCLFFRNPPNQNVNTRLQNENVPAASGQPEMFDAWMGERALDGLNWEKSMVSITVRLGSGRAAAHGTIRCGLSQPFSVTILMDPESSNRTSHAVRKEKARKSRGNSATKREQDTGSSRLRAAVLVAMPSPLHAQSRVSHTASGGSMWDDSELAIGLIETPWIQEDHHSLKRIAS